MPQRITVLSIRGSVIDVHLDRNLPAINNLLRAGERAQVLIEVWAQLDAHRVRGIAMIPAQGLAEIARPNIESVSDDLRHSLNRLRQSSIDEELFDVAAGFNALA